MTKEKNLKSYLLFIEKAVSKKVWIRNVREDIEQEVFIKLFKAGFFEKHDLEDGLITTYASRYIFRTVNSCFSDYVIRKDFIKKTHIEEDEINTTTEFIEKNVNYSLTIDLDEDIHSVPTCVSLEAKQALELIKKCFELSAEMNPDNERLNFLEAAFWRRIYLDINLKDLAKEVGFIHSNPSQEFNRFVAKVSTCTEKDGVKITNPSEQIEILLDLSSSLEEAREF
jgi:hypothetical protein